MEKQKRGIRAGVKGWSECVGALVFLYLYRLIPHAPTDSDFVTFCLSTLGVAELRHLKEGLPETMKGIAGFQMESNEAMVPQRPPSCVDPVIAATRALEWASDLTPGAALARVLHPVMRPQLRARAAQAAWGRRRDAPLASVFKLTRPEVDVLLYFFSLVTSGSFCQAYSERGWLQHPWFSALAVGLPEAEFRALTSDRGTLHDSGILVRESGRFGTVRQSWLSENIQEYLEENGRYPLHERHCRQSTGPTFPLSSFQVGQSERSILLALLHAGEASSLLFFGEPGTGKSEFVRSLCAEAGRAAFMLNLGRHDSVPERCMTLRLVARTIDPARDVLVVDEADGILNTDFDLPTGDHSISNAWLNTFLDGNRITVIWIANSISRMDPSVRRRFCFALEFKPFTPEQREGLWLRLAAEGAHGQALAPETLGRLARDYCINASGISSVLRTHQAVSSRLESEGITRERLFTTLMEHRLEVHRESGLSAGPSPLFTTEALNLDVPADALLVAVERRLGKAGSDLAAQDRPAAGPFSATGRAPLCLLFWGPPGTGKTELARYIATSSGRRLDVRPASQLLSMYLGATEQNIAAAFRSAEEEGAILLLDEADSFLFSRERSQHSWEASQTNELLMRMECFGGVLICCTNRLDGLDTAALRRFAFKVEFRPLTAEGARALFCRHFPEHDITPDEETHLSRMKSLTPGDFKAARQRLEASDMLSPDRMIEELEREQRYKPADTRAVGF